MNMIEPKKPHINVGPNERLVSVIGGGALVIFALARPSRASFPLAIGGGYMLFRGFSGNCLLYEAIDINRAGKNGRAGIKVDRAMTINRPREEVYRFWRNFENLPLFMGHLKEVRLHGPKQSHWVAKAPMDMSIEWEAEIIEERENELIAWRSLPGSQVENSGTVRFQDATGDRGTIVHVKLKYNPPGGSASAAFASLFGDEPGQQVLESLRHFKQVMEAGEVATVSGQTSGRVQQTEEERARISERRGKDVVQKASEDSFPASDPPGYTAG